MSRLETVLHDLPEAVDWPTPSPHLPTRVTARIESAEEISPRRLWRWAIAVSALALVIGLVPDTRKAVADLFHEAGVRIGFIAETPTIDSDDLGLGEPVRLDEAAAEVSFPLAVPELLGQPDAMFVGENLHISMVWEEEPVLLTQSSGTDPYAEKGIGPDTGVTEVLVEGEPGIWIEGAEHSFTLLDDEGNPIEETSRLAANVLLWSAEGVDLRLELTGDLDRALEIAESMGAP